MLKRNVKRKRASRARSEEENRAWGEGVEQKKRKSEEGGRPGPILVLRHGTAPGKTVQEDEHGILRRCKGHFWVEPYPVCD